jgi:D-amino-acid oxidase
MPKNVCVIGAGVSGLTSAIRIAQDGHNVTLTARDEGKNTTSSVAAAFWYPFWMGEEPIHDWYDPACAADTYRTLETLPRTPETGISKIRLYEYFTQGMTDAEVQKVITSMWWRKEDADLPGLDFKELTYQEVSARSLPKRDIQFRAGISFTTFVVNMGDYLPYLTQRARELGVTFETRTVTERFDLLDYDIVVNCSGIGAKALVPKDTPTGAHRLTAFEGVVVRLTPLEEISDIRLLHTGRYFGGKPLYIVPRSGASSDIILGGSTIDESDLDIPDRQSFKVQHLSWNSLPSDHWIRVYTDRIYGDCCDFEPILKRATILEAKVGYRPTPDPEVRLEREGNVIHNYGHGGAGLTLSWGCAERVVRLLRDE